MKCEKAVEEYLKIEGLFSYTFYFKTSYIILQRMQERDIQV